MLDLSPTKLIIIFVVAMVLLGPKRLPQVARQLGAGWRRVREFTRQMDQEVRQNIPDLPSSQEIARFARSPVSLLNRLADLPVQTREPLVADPAAPSAPAAGGADPGADPSAGVAASTNGGRTGAAWPEDTGVVSGPLGPGGTAGGVGATNGWGANGAAANGVGATNGAGSNGAQDGNGVGGGQMAAPVRGPAWDPAAGGLAGDDPSLN